MTNGTRRWGFKSTSLAGFALLGSVALAGAADQTYQFDIPPEPLGQALNDFSQAAAQQIIFSNDAVAGRNSTGLHGRFTVNQALATLLAGTDLKMETNATGVLMVQSKNVEAASNNGAAAAIETVVVTGSHLKGVNVTSPLVVITKGDIDRSGATSVGEVINRLPQAFGGGAQSSVTDTAGGFSTQNTQNGGAIDSPNLRGLGSQATLTLFDGQRLAPDSEFAPVDASIVPLGLVDHVEVLTDGASAIYGADAVAGVVNLVPRKNFDGQETNFSIGDATAGGAFELHADQLFGRKWDDGNVLASYSYTNQNALRARDRDYTAGSDPDLTLIPGASKSSVFIDINQDVDSDLSGFFEGLYTNRHSTTVFPLGGGTGYTNDLRLNQYAINGGLHWHMFADWDSTLALADAVDNVRAFPSLLTEPEKSHNEIQRVEGNATGTLFLLPWGAVQASFGGGYEHQLFNENDGVGAVSNLGGSRDEAFAYAEVQAPLIAPDSERTGLERLELNAAVRWEHYSDFGSTTNPKIGLLYEPFKDLEFKGSWGTSFRPPTLVDIFTGLATLAYPFPNALSPTGTTNTLYLSGGNPTLKPETANTWSATASYSPSFLSGFRVDATYFHIGYKNLILSPLANPFGAYVDPFAAPYVNTHPSLQLVQSLINTSLSPGNFGFENPLGLVPTDIQGIVDNRSANVAAQRSEGVDLSASYSAPLEVGQLSLAAGATWNTLTQQLFANTPAQTISGTVYNVPKFKALGNIGWSNDTFGAIATVHYISGEADTFNTPSTRISSWTTADLQLSWYSPTGIGFLANCRASLSILNIFDANPPRVDNLYTEADGPNYDPTNASPLGRTVRLQLTTDW